ncbi:MAG TPA: M6 family metalloprotease domain-containing protein, partial [Gemmatimonadales bacterium]
GPKEPRGLDFRPDGAWRKQARAVRQARRAALARGDLRFVNSGAASATVSGTYHLPVVFVQFSDTVAGGFQLDTAAYDRLLFGANPNADGRPYSVSTFYNELSNGNITLTGDLYGWISTPYTKLFVGQNCHGVFPGCTASAGTHFGAFLVAALDSLNSATQQVDWSLYDQDDDGFVDFVTFIHPTIGGECTSISQASDIWAHRFFISALRGLPYQTKTPWPGHAGQFMKIEDYIIQSSRGGNGGCTAGSMMPIGTTAHETGHAFGLPDLYDTNNSDEGIGEWGLMGSGNYARPYSPSAMEGWSLSELGWISIAPTTAGSITIGPVQTADSVLRVPFSGTDEFLILENRQSLQSDTAQMNPLLGTPPGKSPGLLIWQVDQSVIDGGRSSNSVNAGAQKGLRLVQADGLNNLQDPGVGGNRGDRGDPFPGGANITSATPTTNPSLLASNGRVGRSITAITQVTPGGPMSFTLSPSKFKLQVTTVGSGTVSSSGGGNIAVGVFTDSAATTTLTAHINAGQAFTGWSGDTTGTDSVMALPVLRPYNVTANFTGVVAVTYDQATNAILGLAALTGPQATYLDDVGNNNNLYDLGDYLAYLKANGLVLAPEVSRRLGSARPLTRLQER